MSGKAGFSVWEQGYSRLEYWGGTGYHCIRP